MFTFVWLSILLLFPERYSARSIYVLERQLQESTYHYTEKYVIMATMFILAIMLCEFNLVQISNLNQPARKLSVCITPKYNLLRNSTSEKKVQIKLMCVTRPKFNFFFFLFHFAADSFSYAQLNWCMAERQYYDAIHRYNNYPLNWTKCGGNVELTYRRLK